MLPSQTCLLNLLFIQLISRLFSTKLVSPFSMQKFMLSPI
jgi:hypothetical protein